MSREIGYPPKDNASARAYTHERLLIERALEREPDCEAADRFIAYKGTWQTIVPKGTQFVSYLSKQTRFAVKRVPEIAPEEDFNIIKYGESLPLSFVSFLRNIPAK